MMQNGNKCHPIIALVAPIIALVAPMIAQVAPMIAFSTRDATGHPRPTD